MVHLLGSWFLLFQRMQVWFPALTSVAQGSSASELPWHQHSCAHTPYIYTHIIKIKFKVMF